MENKDIVMQQEHQFDEVVCIILHHRSRASMTVNEEMLFTAWNVGGYVSRKLKTEEWGSKVVTQLSEYIRSKHPDLKGYGRRNLYNMVMFYDEYSSVSFSSLVAQYLSKQFMQAMPAQISNEDKAMKGDSVFEENGIVQSVPAQLPKILTLTTLTNHVEILCRCKTLEERLFYILYSNKERLSSRELQRCITNQTYTTLLGSKKSMSKGLLDIYPDAPVVFKDTLFVDFLGLPKKHSETKLKKGLVEHMKQFILELGKDFIFMDQEYSLNVGASTFKADLLFFHRGLQALVAVDLLCCAQHNNSYVA